MPLVEVTLTGGRSAEQIRALIHQVTGAVERAVGAPTGSIQVVVREVPATHWAAADVTIAERRENQAGVTDTPGVIDSAEHVMTSKSSFGHLIDGEEVGSLDGATFDSVDPWLRTPWTDVAFGKAGVERAIAAARKAFDQGPWPRIGSAERDAIIHRLAALIEQHAPELAMADTNTSTYITGHSTGCRRWSGSCE